MRYPFVREMFCIIVGIFNSSSVDTSISVTVIHGVFIELLLYLFKSFEAT